LRGLSTVSGLEELGLDAFHRWSHALLLTESDVARIVSKQDSKLRLTADGRWLHDGEPATHQGVKRFFHRQIRKDDGGDFYLYNALTVPEKELTLEEHVYFEVDDTAYFVDSVELSGAEVTATLNTERRCQLPPGSLLADAEGHVYGRLPSGDLARFSRQAMSQLEPYLAADEAGFYLDVDGIRVPFEPLPDKR
jgi:hypothetical protein